MFNATFNNNLVLSWRFASYVIFIFVSHDLICRINTNLTHVLLKNINSLSTLTFCTTIAVYILILFILFSRSINRPNITILHTHKNQKINKIKTSIQKKCIKIILYVNSKVNLAHFSFLNHGKLIPVQAIQITYLCICIGIFW